MSFRFDSDETRNQADTVALALSDAIYSCNLTLNSLEDALSALRIINSVRLEAAQAALTRSIQETKDEITELNLIRNIISSYRDNV